jgi:hypothetical protein
VLLLIVSLTNGELITRVISGYTLVLKYGRKVRLIGAETLLKVQSKWPVKYLGIKATVLTRKTLEGKEYCSNLAIRANSMVELYEDGIHGFDVYSHIKYSAEILCDTLDSMAEVFDDNEDDNDKDDCCDNVDDD